MTISIIIATKDRHDLVRLLLVSISKSSISNFEVIIVDQSATLFSLDIDYTFPILILNHTSGASSSRNYGAQFAKNNYLWFLDDDCTIDPRSEFHDLSNHMIYFVEWHERKKSKLLFTISYFLPILRTIMFIRASGAPFFIINKKIFFEIGGYDTNLGPGCRLGAAEDLDLCLRTLEYLNKYKNKDYRYLKKVILHHKLEIHNTNKRHIYLESRNFVYNKLNIRLILLFDLIYSLLIFDFERYRILRSN